MKKLYILCGIILGNCLGIINTLFLLARTGMLIRRFGVEVNSVFQAANQIFAYFLLMESGIGAAYLYRMYLPMLKRDFSRLNSYYGALCISMKQVALKMSLVLLPVAILYPILMSRKEIEYCYATLILFFLGLRFVLPYYISVANKNLLIVYGYKWLSDIISSSSDLLVTIFEIILLLHSNFSIGNILLFSILLTVIGNLLFNLAVQCLCKEVIRVPEKPDFTPATMTRDIIFHQVGGLFNNNVDTLILSFIDLAKVTVYQAYYALASYPIAFMCRFSEIFRARIGLDIAREDGSVYVTFQQLLTVHLWAVISIIAVFYSCIEDVVVLWIGDQFILNKKCVILLCFWIFDRVIMHMVFTIRDGRGLYRESRWYSLIEGVLNLLFSLLLVRPFGITGLLIGTVMANLLWNEPCNFFLIYKKVFHKKVDIYRDFLITGVAVLISVWIYRKLWITVSFTGWMAIFVDMLCQGIIALIVGLVVFIPVKLKYIKLFIRNNGG